MSTKKKEATVNQDRPIMILEKRGSKKATSAEIQAKMEAGKVEVMKVVEGVPGAEKLAENLKLAKDYNGAQGLVSVQLGPHAPYTVPFELMKDIADAAKENDLAVQLHWLETTGRSPSRRRA